MFTMKVNPLVLLPGTLFWVAVVAAIVTQEPVVIGLAVVLGVGTFAGFAVLAVARGNVERKTKKRVWAEGSPATARILASRTNGSLNDDPYVELDLEVGGRTVAVRQLISQIQLSKVAQGLEIDVKVDVLDPTVVVVDEALTPRGYS